MPSWQTQVCATATAEKQGGVYCLIGNFAMSRSGMRGLDGVWSQTKALSWLDRQPVWLSRHQRQPGPARISPKVSAVPSTTSGQDGLLAWFFVLVRGSCYLASKAGMQYAPPFIFLSLRALVAGSRSGRYLTGCVELCRAWAETPVKARAHGVVPGARSFLAAV